MNDNDAKTATNEAGAAKEPAAAKAERRTSEEAAWEEVVDRLDASAGEVERLESEKADLTDRLVRLAADMDNLRKRTERDVGDAHKYAVTKFAGDMLIVADNLRRALGAIPPEKRAAGDEAFDALIEGVEMTEREMDRLLARNGVTRIAAKGERFDPRRHQAMFELPDPAVPAGTVAEVMQEGYQLGDRVLRAALVGVSKGPESKPVEGGS
jgi:molecular chaperone GrpE